MADQVRECNVLLGNLFSVKQEQYQNDDFIEDKVHMSEMAIVDNAKLQDNLVPDIMKQYNISITLEDMKKELSLSEVQYDMTLDNLKVEQGIAAEDIKIEFNNGLLYCEDCHIYYEDYCSKCGMLIHILNKTVPTNADNSSREELPHDVLEIRNYFGEYRIFAVKDIPVGVKFGPFTGLSRTESPWKIKGGKFVVNKDTSKYLNWMQYINPARNISEQNLLVFQYEQNLYYQSTRQLQMGDELLVYFGEEYENSMNTDVEMDFIPATEHIFKNAFACTFCCLGFSSKSYLIKHKTICPGNAAGEFSVEELTQCLSCGILLDQKEYSQHHMTHCRNRNASKSILPTPDNRKAQVNGRKTRQQQIYSCDQSKCRAKYKGDVQGHTSSLCEFQTKYKLNLKKHLQVKHSEELNYKCDTCDYKTNWKDNLKNHIETKHLKEFKYKCDRCDYRTNVTSHLKIHIEAVHLKEFEYKCDVCDYKANRKGNLERHVEARHVKKFRYTCDWCDYTTNMKWNLKQHIDTKHLKEFKYKCDTCDYKTNRTSHLKRHVDSKHMKEFKYKCDACEYKTNQKNNLGRHVEARHLKEVYKYC